MQYPVGCEFNPDTMRNEMVSFLDVALSPVAVSKFCHTVISSWIVGAVFVVAVSCWYLMKKRETRLATESIKIGAAVGLVAAVLAAATGHIAGQDVAKVQPMKLAAMEALYNGGTDLGLTAIAWVNPFAQPDYENEQEAPLKIEMPYFLSFMATNDFHGYVPGINDILNGYTRPDGFREPSVDEKIARGRQAISALAKYRGNEGNKEALLSVIKENMPYFGYGYLKDKNDAVPYIPVNFWAFRIMVGLGCLFILFFAVVLAVTYKVPAFLFKKYDITSLPSWHYWLSVVLVPLAYIASESGWLVAEFGRQPWTIQDMLPTWVSASNIGSTSVAVTFFLFLMLFTLMLCVEINIMLKQIKKGPGALQND